MPSTCTHAEEALDDAPVDGGGRFRLTVAERNMWAHHVFNVDPNLLSELIIQYRNWDISRDKVRGQVMRRGGLRLYWIITYQGTL